MSREEAKRRAELYQALADGKTLQGNFPNLTNPRRNWCDLGFEESMQLVSNEKSEPYLRIKPEPKKQWFRVYLTRAQNFNKNETFFSAVCTNSNVNGDSETERQRGFVRWLTGRIEYELPEV